MTDGQVPLRDAFASPESKQRYVRRLFSTIADRYDLITILLSFGLDRRWKRRAMDLADIRPRQSVLDLACGTGDLAFESTSRGASVVGLDVTLRMLQLARARRAAVAAQSASNNPTNQHPALALVQGDMMSLPFEDHRFDAVTTGYGLRNVPQLAVAVREIHRVLKRGGTLISLDFNRPSQPAVRAIYLSYLTLVGSLLGWILHRDADTYRYIPASIQRYPGAPALVSLMKAEGFARAEWKPVLGGLMAIHRAVK